MDGIEIRWPSGLVQKLGGGGVDRILTLVEPGPGQASQ
jgi:hypothetical protein